MTYKHLSFMFFTLLCCLLCGCGEKTITPENIEEELTLFVADYTVWERSPTDPGEQTEFILVSSNKNGPWQKLAKGTIVGFNYEHGHAYEIKVRRSTPAQHTPDDAQTTYLLLEIVNDTPPENLKPETVPDEAQFTIKLVQVETFAQVDSPVPAPFDWLTFQVVNKNDNFGQDGRNLQYFDSVVVTSPAMPHTFCIYKKENSGTRFTSKWTTCFFEKSDILLVAKGYKDNHVKYTFGTSVTMRARHFLGMDWVKGDLVLQPSKTTTVFGNVLDRRYEFWVKGPELINNTPCMAVQVYPSTALTDVQNMQRAKEGLEWLMKKHMKTATALTKADFKTLPETAEVAGFYENETTRAALLSEHHAESGLTDYKVVAEPK